MAGIELERIAQLFARRGERVILVLPQGEMVVLVPLAEYEKMVTGENRVPINNSVTVRRSKANPTANANTAPKAPLAAANPLEAVDPLQGALTNDDQYYPEPLEG